MNPQADANVVPPGPARSASGHRVLVAEDEALIRLDLVEMLRWIQRGAVDRRTTMKAVAQAVWESLS